VIDLPEDGGGRKYDEPVRRQGRIAEYVLEQGSAPIKDLSDLFGVSFITIHRDLDELERRGVLRKLRGRVTAHPSSSFDSNVRYRLRAAHAEKEALAAFALTLVEPGQAVMLDESTTALALANLLPSRAPLTVITNFVMVLNRLAGVDEIDLIALGGRYQPHLAAFGGVVCEAATAAISADVLFLSTSAVADCSAMHQDQVTMSGKRAMMAAARRRVLLIDHTKLGKVALHKLAPLRDFDLVVVDDGVDEAQLAELRKCRVPVEVAPVR